MQIGRTPGVYTTWAECESQVKGFSGAKYKSFSSRSLAEEAVRNGWEAASPTPIFDEQVTPSYIKESLSVDAACSGNPGELEYQCVDTATGEQVFSSVVYPLGTNNLGEFLGVVDALRYLHEKDDRTTPIYTDSVSALAWVRNANVKTSLYRNDQTEALFQAIDEAIHWLNAHHYMGNQKMGGIESRLRAQITHNVRVMGLFFGTRLDGGGLKCKNLYKEFCRKKELSQM